jgi:hypothetical protein
VSAAVALPPPPAPPAVARRSRTTVLAVFVGALVGAMALAVLLTLLNSSHTGVENTCRYPDPCGPPTQSAELISQTPWDSPLGFGLRYDANVWRPGGLQDDHTITLLLGGRTDAVLRVQGSTGAEPQDALDAFVADLQAHVPDLAEDDRAFRLVLGPEVGYVDGVGASYSGHIQTAQGPGPIVTASIMAARQGDVTVVAGVVMIGQHWIQTNDDGSWDGEDVFQAADAVINTVRWGGTSS